MSNDLHQTSLHRHALAVGSTLFVVWIAVAAAGVDYFAVLLLPHVIS